MSVKTKKSKLVTRLGIDIDKNTFQLHGVDSHYKLILARLVQQSKLLEVIAKMSPRTIGMEAC